MSARSAQPRRRRRARPPAFTGATRRSTKRLRVDTLSCGPTSIRAGAAASDLTPPITTPMFAYTARSGLANPENTPQLGLQVLADPESGFYAKSFVASRGIHTRVKARTIVLQTPAGKFALVQVDLGGIPYAMTQAVQRRIAGTGIPADRILISATHTHSSTGPIWPGGSAGYAALGGDLFDSRIFDLTASGIAESINAANARLEPARVGIGRTDVRDASRNRRVKAFARNKDLPRDPAARKAAEINPELHVIRVDSKDGRPLGVWSNFAIHATSFGDENLLFSGDNPGAAERVAEDSIEREAAAQGLAPRNPVVNVWTNSAEGDISPNGDPQMPGDDGLEPEQQPTASPAAEAKEPLQYVPNSFAKSHLAGVRVARGLVRAWRHAGGSMRGSLAADARRVFVDFDGQEAEGEPVGPLAALGGGGIALPDGVCAPVDNFAGPGQGEKLATPLVGTGLVPRRGPVSLWRLGPLGLAAFPSEVTKQMGKRITDAAQARAGGQLERVALVGLTNSYQSYTSTPEEYGACAYEGSFTLYGRRQGPRYAGVARSLAGSIFGGPATPSAAEPEDLLVTSPAPPAPGPTPDAGQVVAQPAAAVRRFGQASFRWRGGNPQVDAPRGQTFVSLQRQGSGGAWSTVATEDSFADTVERDDENVWTERYQFNECSVRGTYRFHVTGRANRGGGVAPYEVNSRAFRVEDMAPLKVDQPVVSGTTATVKASYPDPGKEALLALPARVRSGFALFEVRSPGRKPRRVLAGLDRAGLQFQASVPARSSVRVLEVRDRCDNRGG